MAVPDDLRRLSQIDSIFLGWSAFSSTGNPLTSWHKGRVQQAADGSWIFRSIAQDGSVIGYQLGFPTSTWSSDETPANGVRVAIPVSQMLPTTPPFQLNIAAVLLQQQLPTEMTN